MAKKQKEMAWLKKQNKTDIKELVEKFPLEIQNEEIKNLKRLLIISYSSIVALIVVFLFLVWDILGVF